MALRRFHGNVTRTSARTEENADSTIKVTQSSAAVRMNTTADFAKSVSSQFTCLV